MTDKKPPPTAADRALATLHSEVIKESRPGGLVNVTRRLAAIWKEAERVCGHRLNLDGTPRREK